MVIALQTVVAVIGASWPKRRAGLGNALFSWQGPAAAGLCAFGQKRRLVLALAFAAQKSSIAVAAPHRRIIAGAPSPCARLRCKERAAPRTQRKRAPAIWQGPLKMGKEKAGTYLFSQVVSNQVSSAQPSLTSVFGMGTGGTLASSAPAMNVLEAIA